MKTLFFAMLATFLLAVATVIPVAQASAQRVTSFNIPVADTLLTDNDTLYVNLPIDGSWRSVEPYVIEKDGTTAGKVYLEARNLHFGVGITSTWDRIDSLTLADVTTPQFKRFTVPNPRVHAAYRITFIKSGTGSARVKLFYLRYTGASLQKPPPLLQFASIFFKHPSSLQIPAVKNLAFLPMKIANQDRA